MTDTQRPPLAALVAGGTGNVGRHIVRALLGRGATVIVTSRSDTRLAALRRGVNASAGRLVTITGAIGDETDAIRLRAEIAAQVAAPLDAVVASLGRYRNAPSLLGAARAELVEVLEDYVVAHFMVARTFIPVLERGGSYVMINGPSASTTWAGSGLVSTATAAQAMLARVLAEEVSHAGALRFTELVIHPSGYIGPDDAPGSGPLDGAAVGRYVANLLAGRVAGGAVVHLESAEQLA